MELRQLRYLIGISEAGSLLAASRILHIAQPALSQHIASLEHELGSALFVRSNRGMTLTDAGRTFVEHARIVLADVERAKNSVHLDQTDITGNVVVGLPTTVALVATLPILKAARARYPGIRLKLIESHSGFLREWLQIGRLDLTMLFGAPVDAGLEQRKLLEERLVLVTSAAGQRSGREVALRTVARSPLLLPGKDHGLRRIIDAACTRAGLTLDVVAEIDSLPNIKKAVEAGLAHTILSPGAVAEEVEAGRLAICTINRPYLSRTVVCATCVTRPTTRASVAMIALVSEEIESLVRSKAWPARWIGG